MTGAYAAMLTAVALTTTAQLLLKAGARPERTVARVMLAPRTLAGYALLLAVTVLNVVALREISLGTLTAWSSASFPLVVLGAGALLGERPSPRAYLAAALVAAGIVVVAW